MTERGPLSAKCAEMLAAVQAAGQCKRWVGAERNMNWEVAGRRFHAFTGDALASRGLLEHFIDEHDGYLFDRYRAATVDGEKEPSR